MAKRGAETVQPLPELVKSEFSSLTSPFAQKIPKVVNDVQEEVQVPDPVWQCYRMKRKRKHSDDSEVEDNQEDDGGMEIEARDKQELEGQEKVDVVEAATGSNTQDFLDEYTKAYDFMGLEPPVSQIADGGCFQNLTLDEKEVLVAPDSPESNSGDLLDEDDSNEEDNWRNDYPDEDDLDDKSSEADENYGSDEDY